ncbi:MAG: hypothetical protein ACF8XB_12945 [Planctomycetota bacterium JB042]
MSERNVIVHANDPGDELPVNHVAETLREFLAKRDASVPTEVVAVDDPIGWLRAVGALQPGPVAPPRIRHFFSLSHAWEGGLTLGPEHTGARKAELAAEIVRLGGRGGEGEDAAPRLTEGPDDLTQYRTHQLRISNLRHLPAPIVQRLREVFADAVGIFVAGCNTANEDMIEDAAPTFCTELAAVLNKTVHGANYYSKVFGYVPDPSGDGTVDYEWESVDLAASAPHPGHPVLLVPASWGGRQLVKYLFLKSFPETGVFEFPPFGIEDPPDVDDVGVEKDWTELFDVIGLYRRFLTPCSPAPEAPVR